MLKVVGSGVAVGMTFFGFASAAMAQSSVTLYGTIDSGVGYVRNSGQSSYRQEDGISSSSAWGLRGVESIDNDLRAVFTLENGFSVSDGTISQTGMLFGRQAYAGLSSARFGSITLGRQYTPSYWALIGNYTALGLGNWGHAGGIANYSGIRVNNAIVYTSSTSYPLVARLMYSRGAADEQPGLAGKAGRFAGGSLEYNSGVISASLTFDQYYDSAISTVGGQQRLNRNYEFGGALAYQATEALKVFVGGYNNNPAGADNEIKSAWVGATWKQGLYTFAGQIGRTWIGQFSTINSVKANSAYAMTYGALAMYSLSKRTDLYVSAGKVQNADGASNGLRSSTYTIVPTAAGGSVLAVALGLKHRF